VSRIISGQAGSIRLKSAASSTRPTSDRVKESLFAALEARDLLNGSRVLDLFAGTGALALEALSRGAQSAVLVEKDSSAHKIALQNTGLVLTALAKSNIQVSAENLKMDAGKYLKTSTEVFDLVFIDPPYEFPNELMINLLTELELKVEKDGIVVIERSTRGTALLAPKWLGQITNKAVGETSVAIYQKN